MLIKADMYAAGGGNANYYHKKIPYNNNTTLTIHSKLTNITRVSVICVTNASDLYVSEFEYMNKNGTVTYWSDYKINNGSTANLGIRHGALTAGSQQQCPNITNIAENGDITINTPAAAIWNTGTMYVWVSNESLE